MTNEKKMTKVEYFGELRTLIENAVELDNEMQDDLLAFVDKEVELLKNKADKARERAAKKKAEGDELRDTVQGLLTGEYQNTDEIMEKLNDPDVSRAKVTARLTQLVNAKIAEKEQQKTEEGRKAMFYRLIQEVEVTE